MKRFDYKEYCDYMEKEREGASQDKIWLLDHVDDVVHDFIIRGEEDETK